MRAKTVKAHNPRVRMPLFDLAPCTTKEFLAPCTSGGEGGLHPNPPVFAPMGHSVDTTPWNSARGV